MKIEYLKKEEVTKKAKVELNPCDFIDVYGKAITQIKRIVENDLGVYVVFNDGTHRPMSTYGKTWGKIFKE